MLKEVIVSFVIPALNEERNIGQTIKSIRTNSPQTKYEIIIVDNGSTDSTRDIARSEKVSLICHENTTIASARNAGVQHSSGDIIIFLDADVHLTDNWKQEINDVIRGLIDHPITITGSRCSVPDGEVWLWKYWFNRLKETKSRYINSGHLITTRELFLKIGGFREDLRTAEDYDFCQRALAYGAEIHNNDKLKVIHMGYPVSLRSFINRERWHGIQDFDGMRSILGSKEALIAISNLIVIIIMILLTVIEWKLVYVLIYLVFALIISISSTLYKFKFRNMKYLINTSIIFFFYYVGRLEAMFYRRELNNAL